MIKVADFAPRVRTTAGLLRDILYITGFMVPLLITLAYGLYALNRETILNAVKEELGIDKLATQESVNTISKQLVDLTDAVKRATGEDRIIRQQPGLSYVSEPVSVGEKVILNLVLERTNLGKSCVFKGGQSLFVDRSNVVQAGSTIPFQTNVSVNTTRLRVVIDPPESLKVGRVELYLLLEYECNGDTIYDRTETVTFKLLPKN